MRVRFWGVRGSVPWATPQAIGHGCNTPCVELIDEASHERLVIDAGSGIVGLGESLGASCRSIPILLSHYHWDHLQGLPFFGPIYQPALVPVLWAPSLDGYDVGWAEKVFQSPFFPVPFDKLPGPPAVRVLASRGSTIGPFDVRSFSLTHPGGAVAYRIRGLDGDVVYASDHEIGEPAVDEGLRRFIAGASAVIFDAHFTAEELQRHRGWGHSSWNDATALCAAAGVKRLWLFHHKPGRTDSELVEIEAMARRILADTNAAGEGDTFEV